MEKTFKILAKDPYTFTSKQGKTYDKCRYKTDSDILDVFNRDLEVGRSYKFEAVETQSNGRIFTNWKFIGEVIQNSAPQNSESQQILLGLDESNRKLDELKEMIIAMQKLQSLPL